MNTTKLRGLRPLRTQAKRAATKPSQKASPAPTKIKTVRVRAKHMLVYRGRFSEWQSTPETLTHHFGGNEVTHYVWDQHKLEWVKQE